MSHVATSLESTSVADVTDAPCDDMSSGMVKWPHMTDRRSSALALLLLAAFAAAVSGDAPTAVRLPLTLVVVLFVPGAAWVGLLRLRSGLAAWILTCGLSLSLSVLVAEGLVWADRLTLRTGVTGLVLVSSLGLLIQLVVGPRWLPAVAPATDRRYAGSALPSVALTAASAVLW